MLQKSLLVIATTSILLAGFAKPAFAVSTPDFGSCVNPQVVSSQVNTGTHGVAGRTQTYTGKDSIYTLSNGNVLQCLCPDNGSGVQTNWLKASNVSSQDVETLKSQGWEYIPTGSVWGLSDTAYLAKNSDYSCTATGGGSTSTPSSTTLGLAKTGNMLMIYGFLTAGLTALLSGMMLKKFSK
jgi:Tfp pilus assembly protein PilV